MAVMDILIRAKDEASDVFEGVASKGGEAASFLEDNLAKVGAAAAVAGAGAEGFARSQSETNATLARMAQRTGESEESLRSMIGGMDSWNLSSGDATAAMELLSQRGVDTKDGFENLIPVWDNFADATGQDMVKGMEDGMRTMGAFGISAEDAGDNIDTLTFMTNELGVPMDRLSREMRNSQEEAEGMNLTMDDSAAMMKALSDRGLDGRDAVNLYGKALRESDGDMDVMLEKLGITAEEFEANGEAVANASGMTEEFAEINNGVATPLEKLQQNLENTMMKYGGLAEAAGLAAPVLMAMGPILKGLAVAKKLVAGAAQLMGKAMTFALGPIGLIIAAIAAAIAIGYLIYKNWDTISAFLIKIWEWIKEAAVATWTAISEFFTAVFTAIKDFITGVWTSISDFLSSVWDGIKTAVEFVFDAILAYFKFVFNVYKTIIMTVWNAISTAIQAIWKGIKIAAEVVFNALKAFFERVLNGWKKIFTTIWNAIRDVVVGIWNGIKGTAETVFNAIKAFFERVLNGWKTIFSTIWNAIRDTVVGIWNGLKETAAAVFEGIKSAITTPIETVKSFIITAFETVRDRLSAVWDGITGSLSTAFSSMVGIVRGPINGVIGLVNRAIRSINGISIDIPSWVPGVGGSTFGVNIPTIPRLAKGGMFIAGEAGPESVRVAPLGRDPLTKEIREIRAMLAGAGGSRNSDVNIVQHIQGMTPEEVLRQTKRAIREEVGAWWRG